MYRRHWPPAGQSPPTRIRLWSAPACHSLRSCREDRRVQLIIAYLRRLTITGRVTLREQPLLQQSDGRCHNFDDRHRSSHAGYGHARILGRRSERHPSLAARNLRRLGRENRVRQTHQPRQSAITTFANIDLKAGTNTVTVAEKSVVRRAGDAARPDQLRSDRQQRLRGYDRHLHQRTANHCRQCPLPASRRYPVMAGTRAGHDGWHQYVLNDSQLAAHL
jgi:hypothetical protein